MRSLGFKGHRVGICSVNIYGREVRLPPPAKSFSIKDGNGDGLKGRASATYKAKHLKPFKFWLEVPDHLVPEKLKRK